MDNPYDLLALLDFQQRELDDLVAKQQWQHAAALSATINSNVGMLAQFINKQNKQIQQMKGMLG